MNSSSRRLAGIPSVRRPSMAFYLGLIIAMVAPRIAWATLVAYDDFNTDTGNYVVSSNLAGQSSSSDAYGFLGTWGGANSNNFQIYSISMPRDGITNSGAAVRLMAGNTNSRADSRGYTAAANQGTLYFGALMRFDSTALTSGNEAEIMAGFTSGTVSTTSAGTGAASWSDTNGGSLAGFQWGVSSGNTLVVKYQSDFGGTGSILTYDTGFTLNSGVNNTYFIVARLDVNSDGTNDLLRIWALTSVPTSESALLANTPVASITGNILGNSGDLDTVLLTTSSGSASNAYAYLDALRVGTDYTDLLGTSSIPEPSSAAVLLGAAALFSAVCLSRGRRSTR